MSQIRANRPYLRTDKVDKYQVQRNAMLGISEAGTLRAQRDQVRRPQTDIDKEAHAIKKQMD